MENTEILKLLHDLEAEQLASGKLPDRIDFGAWRPLKPGEVVDCRFVEKIGGVELVPVRLFGNPDSTVDTTTHTTSIESNVETAPIQLVAEESLLIGQQNL